MNRILFRRAVLSAALALGVWTGLAHADAPVNPAPTPQPAPVVVVVNGIVYSNTGVAAASPCATPGAPCAAPEGHAHAGLPHPLRDFCQTHKLHCCWAHFNNYTCGSAESEYAFIFGSCRNFFGEPCVSGPPGPAFPGEQPLRNVCPNCARP